jgi:hypothetical protein
VLLLPLPPPLLTAASAYATTWALLNSWRRSYASNIYHTYGLPNVQKIVPAALVNRGTFQPNTQRDFLADRCAHLRHVSEDVEVHIGMGGLRWVSSPLQLLSQSTADEDWFGNALVPAD